MSRQRRADGGGPAPLLRVCVTGPESTGKTTLAQRLAEWGGTEWVPEAARIHAERATAPLASSDAALIAREHVALADARAARARERGARLLVLDQDLLSTVVYARHYYATVAPWIVRAERERRADLYLLCDVDVPWRPDGVRDRPLGREAMFARFRQALERRRAETVVIRGGWDARWQTARAAVSAALASA
jgi:NadR type nicotinamide-nucleotide adenylyltransferase